MTTKIDIDSLLRDTALFVVALNNNGHADQGRELYQRGVSLVEQARATLQEAKISAENTGHILYAQCALLDETVLNRTITRDSTTADAPSEVSGQGTADLSGQEIGRAIQDGGQARVITGGQDASAVHPRSAHSDSGYQTWIVSPLQARFFNVLNAGEMLIERMRQVLGQPAPDPLVLACFQRVLALGFQGRYRDRPQQAQELQALMQALTERAGHRVLQPEAALLLSRPVRRGRFWCKRSLLFWTGCGVVTVALLWFGLNWGLRQALLTWLPAVSG